ncbi:hypothetical protein BDL97_01G146400 [Sphagnum fallax]|nr:hypothetical protein BDL97_01G146400 [Sphagnum fallax]
MKLVSTLSPLVWFSEPCHSLPDSASDNFLQQASSCCWCLDVPLLWKHLVVMPISVNCAAIPMQLTSVSSSLFTMPPSHEFAAAVFCLQGTEVVIGALMWSSFPPYLKTPEGTIALLL